MAAVENERAWKGLKHMRKIQTDVLMDMDCEWTQMVKEDGIRDSSWVSSWSDSGWRTRRHQEISNRQLGV